jgi:hypothetical protein
MLPKPPEEPHIASEPPSSSSFKTLAFWSADCALLDAYLDTRVFIVVAKAERVLAPGLRGGALELGYKHSYFRDADFNNPSNTLWRCQRQRRLMRMRSHPQAQSRGSWKKIPSIDSKWTALARLQSRFSSPPAFSQTWTTSFDSGLAQERRFG